MMRVSFHKHVDTSASTTVVAFKAALYISVSTDSCSSPISVSQRMQMMFHSHLQLIIGVVRLQPTFKSVYMACEYACVCMYVRLVVSDQQCDSSLRPTFVSSSAVSTDVSNANIMSRGYLASSSGDTSGT